MRTVNGACPEFRQEPLSSAPLLGIASLREQRSQDFPKLLPSPLAACDLLTLKGLVACGQEKGKETTLLLSQGGSG